MSTPPCPPSVPLPYLTRHSLKTFLLGLLSLPVFSPSLLLSFSLFLSLPKRAAPAVVAARSRVGVEASPHPGPSRRAVPIWCVAKNGLVKGAGKVGSAPSHSLRLSVVSAAFVLVAYILKSGFTRLLFRFWTTHMQEKL